MTKAIFFFIACLLLILPFIFNAGEIFLSNQLLITTPFLLFLGIPHGAIDNVLYLRNNNIKNSHFIGVYLVFVGLNIALWLILPSIAYILFLLLSAYHFGQSQFSHYFQKQPISHQALYFFWGIGILSALLYLNIEEVHNIMDQHPEFATFRPLHQKSDMFLLFIGSNSISLLLMLYLGYKKQLKVETIFMELTVISLILICFYLLPLLIGFSLYFIILHSYKVLKEEYTFLITEKEIKSWPKFLTMVAPFTFLSIIGIAFLFALIYFKMLSLSYGYCLLIVISSITLPHVFVMNKFYALVFSKKEYQATNIF